MKQRLSYLKKNLFLSFGTQNKGGQPDRAWSYSWNSSHLGTFSTVVDVSMCLPLKNKRLAYTVNKTLSTPDYPGPLWIFLTDQTQKKHFSTERWSWLCQLWQSKPHTYKLSGNTFDTSLNLKVYLPLNVSHKWPPLIPSK